MAEDTMVMPRSRRGAWLSWLPAVLIVAAVIYYLGGAFWVDRIDDNPEFGVGLEVPPEASRSIAVAAALIDREVDQNRWLANDPPFLPGYLLDNAPNFQRGLMSAVGRYTVELRDRLSRVRGSSRSDPQIESAAGRLNYPGDVWLFEWSSAPVQPSSESQYRRGKEDLLGFNSRLADGQGVFERRADNLQNTLDRIANDIGASSAILAQRVDDDAGAWFDTTADDVFYETKGRLYGYHVLLREMRTDFAEILDGRGLQSSWDEMLASLRAAATLHPWIVMNGDPSGLASPNHLANQGFFLLRARTQLREIKDILVN